MNDFDKYYEAEEPGRRERAYGWATAIGLQDVDGLKPSHYLIETAKRNIEGEISADEARRLVDEYYEVRGEHDIPEDTVEADKVSARINQLIRSPSFRLIPEFYIALHGQIFEGVFPHAGSIRTVNISKREWVLNGDTVDYEIESEIEKTLAYDFAQESKFKYKGLSEDAFVEHFAYLAGTPFPRGQYAHNGPFCHKVFALKGFLRGKQPVCAKIILFQECSCARQLRESKPWC